jgi:hypothetical protein
MGGIHDMKAFAKTRIHHIALATRNVLCSGDTAE